MSLAERILQGEIRAAARLMRDIDDGMAECRRGAEEALSPYRTGVHHRGDRAARRRQIDLDRQADRGLPAAGEDGRGGGGRSHQPFHRRRHSRRPHPHEPPRHATTGSSSALSARAGIWEGFPAPPATSSASSTPWAGMSLVETVGVGQDEVEIVRTAHTSLVVMVPGLGDDIQAIKAGILEIADIFVVNKADRPDADRTARDLEMMIEMNHPGEGRLVAAGGPDRGLEARRHRRAGGEDRGAPGTPEPLRPAGAFRGEQERHALHRTAQGTAVSAGARADQRRRPAG